MSAIDDDYVTVAEAATLLRVAVSTFRRWIREGDLPAYRIGKRRVALRRADLDTLITPAQPASERSATASSHDDHPDIGKLTPEEVQRGLAALERIERINQEILARRGGKPFPSSVAIIHEMRDERTRQLG